ncbi:MAG: hypothetical protein WCK42_05570 [Myxococcaceae bacterium]
MDQRVVMLVNTDFETSNQAVINFLNSGRQNIIALKGPRGVFNEFYFDNHPKSIGVSREILQACGIHVPKDGIIDCFALKERIIALRDKIDLPIAALKRLETEKFRTLAPMNAQTVKISDTLTVYANLHIFDLRVRDTCGEERVVRTYQNSPIITDEVKILGIGPETVQVWGEIIKSSKELILMGDTDELVEILLK